MTSRGWRHTLYVKYDSYSINYIWRRRVILHGDVAWRHQRWKPCFGFCFHETRPVNKNSVPVHSPFPHFETVIKLFPPLISFTPFLELITVAMPVAGPSLFSVGSQHISQSESWPLSEWACSRSGFGDHLEAYNGFKALSGVRWTVRAVLGRS